MTENRNSADDVLLFTKVLNGNGKSPAVGMKL